MRSHQYGDILAPRPRRQPAPEVVAEIDMVVETVPNGLVSDFCGAIVAVDTDRKGHVTLEDADGNRRLFEMKPGAFLLEGKPVTLVRPKVGSLSGPLRTASGSTAVPGAPARVARASRIWVEGVHDAQLVEQIWGDDLRIEGVVVEPLHGVDELAERIAEFAPAEGRRVGVLVDHLVPGSKESRIVAQVAHPHVLVTGHPYVDVWQAVKPTAVGIPKWPNVPKGVPWKEGVCRALGVKDTAAMWGRVRKGAKDYTMIEQPLLRAVEELIDFVTA
ncbi:DUF3097 domain-containing protein [Segniliparus rugosus]|uniref:DUF3097 domain-containing protein n=1 Tax=Segniliparus rugosus (strain ATCC BAA-974 / DSM 45345 / CCUG 50838 / CIP 108380 / JCM 13579 / CDC 945) TaxID=679197 RepID=E5XPB7_SEGRC|nr:DUF3097 domain-containing protein [Segniliparus rugosus]EFV13808.1 hypothetical protein HMPREF9336_01339 [Segniliparus rugosus ATCC BAA-974]